jgi:hypothetical protein
MSDRSPSRIVARYTMKTVFGFCELKPVKPGGKTAETFEPG